MKALRALLVFLAVAGATNALTVAALPWLINAYVTHRIASLGGGVNVAIHAPRADATARTIVRPSPDLLYTACVFDVSKRPLHITAPVQDSYVSVAGFSADTTNFFAINDAQIEPGADGRKRFDLVLTRHDTDVVPPGAKAIRAPSDRGLILFRSLISDESALPRLRDEFQAKQECAPL